MIYFCKIAIFHFFFKLSFQRMYTPLRKKKKDIKTFQIISLSDTYFFFVLCASNYMILSLSMIGGGKGKRKKGNKVNWIAVKNAEALISFDRTTANKQLRKTLLETAEPRLQRAERSLSRGETGRNRFSIGIMRSCLHARHFTAVQCNYHRTNPSSGPPWNSINPY